MRDTGKTILFTVLLILLSAFSSCTKDEDVCGQILGGYSEWNDYYQEYNYFFRLDVDNRAQVDELTFNSFRVGDFICITY